jgi:hypothetical protein
MSHLDDARQRLFEGLKTVLPDGRVSKTTPSSVVAPAVWIETPSLSERAQGNSTFIVATFPVMMAVDGDQRVQVLTLDELTARVWDASRIERGNPVSSSPSTIDVGGPNLRAATVNVDIVIVSRNLCNTPIVEEA